MAMELCSSGNLYGFLQRKGQVCERMARSIVKQICQAMEHLHDRNVIHRDLKLENILFQMVHVILYREWSRSVILDGLLRQKDFAKLSVALLCILHPKLFSSRAMITK